MEHRHAPPRLLHGHTVLAVSEDLDLATIPALRERLLGVLHHGGHRLIIDLSEVAFCDAAGLAVLLATERRARLLGGSLRLAAPPPVFDEILRATGFHRHFKVYPTVEAATAGRDWPLHRQATRAWSDVHTDDVRATVAALLSHTDAWRAADPTHRLALSLGELQGAYADKAHPAALSRSARRLLSALDRHPLAVSAEVTAIATRLRRLLKSAPGPILA